jgi:hypothetical protein
MADSESDLVARGGDGARLVWIWLMFGFFVSAIRLRLAASWGRLLFIALIAVSATLSPTIIYEWYIYGSGNHARESSLIGA